MNWTPLKEKRPPSNEWVLVLSQNQICIAQTSNAENITRSGSKYISWDLMTDGCGCCGEGIEESQISHWMPLPEIPQ